MNALHCLVNLMVNRMLHHLLQLLDFRLVAPHKTGRGILLIPIAQVSVRITGLCTLDAGPI
jgi:hypothetical protein